MFLENEIVHNPAVIVQENGKFIIRLRFAGELVRKEAEMSCDHFLALLENARVVAPDGLKYIRLDHADGFEMRLEVDPTVIDLR